MLKAELAIRDFVLRVEGEGPVRSIASIFEGFQDTFGKSGIVRTRILYRDDRRERVVRDLFVTPADVTLTVTGDAAIDVEVLPDVVESFVERYRATGVALVPDLQDIALGIELDSDHE